jgi:hypothetical protein
VKQTFFLLYCIIFVPALLCAQKPDSTLAIKDSLQSPVIAVSQYNQALQTILGQNKFLNSSGTAVSMAVKPKKSKSAEDIFYLLAGLVLLMAIIKFFFARYFANLFRVFFNTLCLFFVAALRLYYHSATMGFIRCLYWGVRACLCCKIQHP